jgi:hypothetical protein
MLKQAIAIALFSTVAAGLASAQTKTMYRWVDEKGKVQYTDRPPAESAGRPSDTLTRQGQVLKKSEGALTPEQEAAREAERKKARDEEAAAREERRKNMALLNTYPSEKDIDEARVRALKQGDEAVKATEKRLAEAAKRQNEYEKEKEFYLKKPMPAKLQQDIKNNELELKNQQELLGVKKKELDTINAKYDEDKRRYIELTRGKGSPAGKAATAAADTKKK